MERRVLSILVKNHFGVLTRVAGLFSRRGYNIDSLTVGVTEDPLYSRMTIVVYADKETLTQIKNQVKKLEDVVTIAELLPNESVFREIVMIKISATASNRAEVIGIADVFRAHIVDVANNSLVIEVTGDESKVSALKAMLEPYGIKEIVRTGLTALSRGENELKKTNN